MTKTKREVEYYIYKSGQGNSVKVYDKELLKLLMLAGGTYRPVFRKVVK